MKFHIIGIDDCAKVELSERLKELLGRSKIFSGGARHRQIVEGLLPQGHRWIEITPPISQLIERYSGDEDVVIFASGDPLFFGFGSTLQHYIPDVEMEIYPTFNSLQTLAHRAQIAYHSMRAVSLTGRNWKGFDKALIEGEALIGVLTDTREHTPEKIAQRMLKYGYSNYSITVGEQLGNCERERVGRYSVEEVAQGSFSHPCNMILEQKHKRKRAFGIADSEFRGLEGRSRMITKRVIRLALLSLLDLPDAHSFWDVGFCTGSVSIEARLRIPHLDIVSFEKRTESREIMEHNIAKFGAMGIDFRIGDFMEAQIDDLPQPDAIFIGGHGGNLEAIVERCAERLKAGGRLVINSVSEESEERFKSATKRCGLITEDEVRMKVDNFNEIIIIKTVKRDE